jgi:hypothetical protein
VNWGRQEVYQADWKRYGRAGPIRNQEMLDKGKPDVVIACPGGRRYAGHDQPGCRRRHYGDRDQEDVGYLHGDQTVGPPA